MFFMYVKVADMTEIGHKYILYIYMLCMYVMYIYYIRKIYRNIYICLCKYISK